MSFKHTKNALDPYRVIGFIPVSYENSVISGGVRERDGNPRTTEDTDATKTTGGFVESERRKVVETSDLIFHLKHVSVILPRRDRACRSVHSVHVRVPPLLYAIPIIIIIFKILVLDFTPKAIMNC